MENFMAKNERVSEINEIIKDKYIAYRDLFSKVSMITNEIKELEEEKISIIEKDGRRLLFKRPAIDLHEFISWIKSSKWCDIIYENFEENNKTHIVDEAMIVGVYCYQTNYIAPVNFIIVLEGYLNKEEYDNRRANNPRLREYYISEESANGRIKI
jgi:hypothetical protein